jgi:hypothetical protein
VEAIDRSQLTTQALEALSKLKAEDKRKALEYIESLTALKNFKNESKNSKPS